MWKEISIRFSRIIHTFTCMGKGTSLFLWHVLCILYMRAWFAIYQFSTKCTIYYSNQAQHQNKSCIRSPQPGIQNVYLPFSLDQAKRSMAD